MVKCVKCGTDLGPAEMVCPICGTPKGRRPEAEFERPEVAPREYFLVDGLTLKDYYDVRDLRLLLWGLEKELYEKYGIGEASELGLKVRRLIEDKIREIGARIG